MIEEIINTIFKDKPEPVKVEVTGPSEEETLTYTATELVLERCLFELYGVAIANAENPKEVTKLFEKIYALWCRLPRMWNEDELQELLNEAKWGDTIYLPADEIVITKPLVVPTNVTIRSVNGTLKFVRKKDDLFGQFWRSCPG